VRAAAISCCSSGDGVQTFRILTFTGGVLERGALSCAAQTVPHDSPIMIRIVRDTAAL